MPNYDAVRPMLGKSFTTRSQEVILRLGREVEITRQMLVNDLKCGHFAAARRLSAVLAQRKITTVDRLIKTDPYDLAGVSGVGDTQVFVAMCLIEHVGGSVDEWFGWNVTFSTLKERAHRERLKQKHRTRKRPTL